MKPVTYPNGSKLRLIPHASLWRRRGPQVAQVDDGTTMERIALRACGETGLAWHGIPKPVQAGMHRRDPR